MTEHKPSQFFLLLNNHKVEIKKASPKTRFFYLAEWTGLEPATPGVTGRYSNQLNYHSIKSAFQKFIKYL
jgi:hypothetical protein